MDFQTLKDLLIGGSLVAVVIFIFAASFSEDKHKRP